MSKTNRHVQLTVTRDSGDTIVIRETSRKRGHLARDQGCGTHDSRPRRCRTRQTQKKRWMKESA